MSIKVIQVGVGGFGTSWRHTLTTTPDVEVVALVDIDRGILDDAAQFFGMPEDRCFLNRIFREVLIKNLSACFRSVKSMPVG